MITVLPPRRRNGFRLYSAGSTLLVMLACAFPCGAACKLTLDKVDRLVFDQGGASGGYDVFATNSNPVAAPVSVRHSKDACSYFIGFDPGQSGTSQRELRDGTKVLRYQLYASGTLGNILRDVPGASVNDVFAGTISPGNQTVEHVFHMVIPAGQVVPPGRYLDTVTVTLYEGTLAGYSAVQSRNLRIETTVPERIDLSLVDSGMAIDPSRTSRVVDFGTLTEGETSSFDLLVRSNAGYTVTMESDNRGVMKILDPADASTVPYTFRVNGAVANLPGANPVTVSSAVTPTTPAGIVHRMLISIGDIGDASAGAYQDNLTITVIANP